MDRSAARWRAFLRPWRRWRATACVLGLTSVFCLPDAGAQAWERFTYHRPQMGTAFRIVLYARDSTCARRAAEAAFARIDTLNRRLSDYRSGSELNGLSATAGSGQAVPVSDDLWTVLAAAQQWAERSDGAFDVTVGPLTRRWRRAIRRQTLPRAEELAAAREAVGYRLMGLDSTQRTVRLARPGMRLDLGGLAKGFAADEALAVLASFGIRHALVDAGGDLVLGAAPPGSDGWRVIIRSVNAEGQRVDEERLLAGRAVAASGDASRHVDVDGVRFSHIVDPRTGWGVTHGREVTVVAPTGMEADALASALSVLSWPAGRALVARRPGAAARIIERDAAGRLVIRTSSAFEKRMAPTTH